MSDETESPGAEEQLAISEAIITESARRIAQIERERKRISREDWATLFRQLEKMATELAVHPFIQGDLEAETRLAKALLADDLEDMDRKIDALGEYVQGKLEYNAALKAAETGEEVEVPVLSDSAPSGSAAAKLSSRQGPSGSDYKVEDGGADAPPPRRRSVLRL